MKKEVFTCASLPTCKHAFIDDTGATDQHGVTWHDGPIAGDDHHVTGHQISRQNFLDICQEICGRNKVSECVQSDTNIIPKTGEVRNVLKV